MELTYTNVTFPHGFDIVERYHNKKGEPVRLRFAWFGHREAAIRYMMVHEKEFPGSSRNRRIVDCASGFIVPWRGISGYGENAMSFEEWASFVDYEKIES